VFAVTVLTSMSGSDLLDVGLGGDALENAMRLARLAKEAGCSGVVCSPHESRDIKASLGNSFLTLTPGIRPGGSAHGDQKRVATPADAVRAGADYLVVGRPITQAPDAFAAARAILDEIHSVTLSSSKGDL
jgi:orotidine-5'-phosphate decarboxylase